VWHAVALNLLPDLRYAFRILRNSPTFALVAVITLALSIGGNIVVFGVLNAVLLRPLAVSNPDTLYQIRHKTWMTGRLLTTSYPAFEDFRRRNTTFSGMAAINAYSGGTLSWCNAAMEVNGDEVSGNYFDLLGVQPRLGRFFHGADERGPNSAPYLVLSYELWRRAFGADPGVVGTAVQLQKHPFTVIGVAPEQFHGTERFVWPDYWIPIVTEGPDYLQDRAHVAVTVIGRLKPGITRRQATENLSAISAQLAGEYPQSDDGLPLRLIHPGLFGDEGEVIRGFLYSVSVLALLVLAAACANLANLFAARTADRGRELAIRMALGSGRRRVLMQLLTEAVLLSVMGGVAGLITASVLLGALNRWRPPFGGHVAVDVDARVYFVALAFASLSALGFGMFPAQRASRSNPLHSMKSGPMESKHLRRFAVRDLLLGLQIAICTLLVSASLVAVRGMQRTLNAPLGFHPHGAMLAEIEASGGQQESLLDALRDIPGVTAAGVVNRTPMTGGLHGVPLYAPGTTDFRIKNARLAPYVFSISPGYLEAAGTRLLSGRDVRWQDTATTPHVAIVNETFARRVWGRSPAIGQRFVLWRNLTEVVGVVETGKYHDLAESPQPVVFVPYAQSDQGASIYVVRSHRAPSEIAAALQRTLSRIAPNVPITVRSWTDDLQGELFPARPATMALGIMGLMAAMLALTGIFGMAAYNVSRRMKELGIRVAVGARGTHVMRAAIGRPVMLLGVGSVLGVLSAFAATGLLRRIVYEANPGDPMVLAGVAAITALLGIAASAIPARRALAIDPAELIREE